MPALLPGVCAVRREAARSIAAILRVPSEQLSTKSLLQADFYFTSQMFGFTAKPRSLQKPENPQTHTTSLLPDS